MSNHDDESATLNDVVSAVQEGSTDYSVLNEVKQLIFELQETSTTRASEHEALVEALRTQTEDICNKLGTVVNVLEQLRTRLWRFEESVSGVEPRWD